MNSRKLWRRRRNPTLIVAPASESTWAVAWSRRLIPGALFRTRAAAVGYASALANAAGLRRDNVKVLGA
jgi:hypothetical protein